MTFISQPDQFAASNDEAWMYLTFTRGDQTVVVAIHVRSQLQQFEPLIAAAIARAKSLSPSALVK